MSSRVIFEESLDFKPFPGSCVFFRDRVEQWGCHRPLIKPCMRFSRTRLSDILLPSAFSRTYKQVLLVGRVLPPSLHYHAYSCVVSSGYTIW